MKSKKLTSNILGIIAAVLGIASIPVYLFLPFITVFNESASIFQILNLLFESKNAASLFGGGASQEISDKATLLLIIVIAVGVVSLLASVFAAIPKKAFRFTSFALFTILVLYVTVGELVFGAGAVADMLHASTGQVIKLLGIGFWINLALVAVAFILSLVAAIVMPSKNMQMADINIPVSGAAGLITFLGGNCAGYQIPVYEGEEVLIGKDPRVCSVCIDKSYTKVSRKHCGVKYDPMQDTYIVTDYSTNGTNVVGGSKLGQYMPSYLQRGTVLNLAKTENSFRLD